MFDDRFGCPDEADIRRCTNCGHRFIDPLRPDSELKVLYETYYGRSGPIHPLTYSRTRAMVLREALPDKHFLGQAKGRSLLDIGCGSGEFLARATTLGFQATGIDVDSHAVEAARSHGFSAHCGTADSDALRDESFDVITLNQVIEHVEDPIATLVSLREHLESAGTLFIATPNGDSASLRRTGRTWINWHVPYHQHIFSQDSLRLIAAAAGLTPVRMSTRTPVIWTLLQQQHTHEPMTLGVERWPWRGPTTTPRPRGSDTVDRVASVARSCVRLVDDLRGAGDCIMATFRRA